jgi:hypothetical protein
MKWLLITMLLALSACEVPGEQVEVASVSGIKVELLFEHEGVKVYRFQDGGRSIYYADASGRTSWRTKSGDVVIDHEVNTVE